MPNALASYIPVCEAIAQLFQPYVEVVLHDLATGKIAHIANSYSKRKVGDSSLLESEPDFDGEADVIGPYPKTRWDGGRLKSITAVLRDGRKRAVGLLCINYDVESFSGALQQLERLIGLPAPPVETPRQLMSKDWQEAANTTIGQFLKSRNVTLAGLTTQDRDELLETLRSEGLFEIRNAVPYVAEILRTTRATIYNRLRAKQQPPQPKRRDSPRTRGASRAQP